MHEGVASVLPHRPLPDAGEGAGEFVLHLGANLVDDLLIFRESACCELGEDQVAVNTDFEAAAIGGDQLDGSEPLAEFIHNRLCQAHGLRHVVSRHAVFDRNLQLAGSRHRRLPS
jgi:hypothetical protein